MPIINENGFITDQETGIIIPRTYQRTNRVTTSSVDYLAAPTANFFSAGVALDRDRETMVVRWPEKGSGLDDLACESMVDGRVANVGIAPIVNSQVSGVIRRQQDQSATATFELSGRKSPVGKARDAIAMFNDSPLGITQAVKLMVRGLRVYNRGVPIATVPIHYDTDMWESMGLNLIPIENTSHKYYLDVDWVKYGTPVPYMPNIYYLEPTGVQEFPYWYHTLVDGQASWILLHKTQILPMTPGETSYYGIGTSAMWMALGVLAEDILVIDARIEKKLNAMTDGVILFTGIQESAAQLKDLIETNREENRSRGYLIDKGTTILTTDNPDGNYVAVNFRQDDGVSFEERRQYIEDVIALCFSEPLSSIVTRGGIGFGAQADTVAENAADTGIGAILHQIAATLGAIYPRVTISVNRPNDLMQKRNIEVLETFANAVQSLPPDTLSREEIRAIIDSTILSIPVIEQDTLTESTAPQDDQSDHPSEGDEDNLKDDQLARLVMAILYNEDGVEITDEDVDQALDHAQTIDQNLYELLIAEEAAE